MNDTTHISLTEAVQQRPFPEYQRWWPMGERFLSFMSAAICPEWADVDASGAADGQVAAHLHEYLRVVYARAPRATLLDDFRAGRRLAEMQSGEFDALSYAFFRASFAAIAAQADRYPHGVAGARRRFTERVGTRFYRQLSEHLALDTPTQLRDAADFALLRASIDRIGAFLLEQGYLRDHAAFSFDVRVRHGQRTITQTADEFIPALQRDGVAYALYEMGYPAILPSAVYLYNTVGEAQHHSSRTIQDHFAVMGYRAHETDDFDPTGFPSDRVVELWEIRPGP